MFNTTYLLLVLLILIAIKPNSIKSKLIYRISNWILIVLFKYSITTHYLHEYSWWIELELVLQQESSYDDNKQYISLIQLFNYSIRESNLFT